MSGDFGNSVDVLLARIDKLRDERDEARKVAVRFYEKSLRCCATCARSVPAASGWYSCCLFRQYDVDECRTGGGYPHWRKRQ